MAFTFSREPTSSKPTVMLFGEMNEPLWIRRRSLSFLHRIYASNPRSDRTSCEVSGCASFCVLYATFSASSMHLRLTTP